MKRIGIIVVLLCISLFSSAQGEGVEAITGNPYLQMKASQQFQRVNVGTFDSTIIYTPDTLTLPFFDEFSTNRFQVFDPDPAQGGATFDKVYGVLDDLGVEIANNVFYTEQVTFRRTVDLGAGTYFDADFSPVTVQIGDLSSYPVVHIPTDAYPPYYIYDTVDIVGDLSDTVWLTPDIYQDSATQFFADVVDPNGLWWDRQAYHNYSMAVDPWSLGVVTFDGLDEHGYPYQLGSTITNYADMLNSKPIDMSAVTAGDSVYFSFLWQAQGFCDPPEDGDSLVLEFYARDLDQWNRVWSTNGVALADFEHEHIRISDADYFKDGFQFRFRNYGGLSGSLDHFHIDYVNLRALSGYQDTIIRDFAFVYPIYTLLDTYTSVPWDHYQNNPLGKMSSNVQVVVRNSDNVPENEQDGSTVIEYNTVQEGSFVLLENLLNNGDLNYSPMTTYFSFHDFSGGDRFDETKPGLLEEFDVISGATHQNSNFTLNDSTYSKQVFENYYSYDDGTAEIAYGPAGVGVQPRLAIQYTPYEADSVIGAMIHFVPTVQDISDDLFLLTIWDDNNGEPGNVIYEDNLFFPRQPSYEYDRNIFTTYYTEDTTKVPVNGTFYIGWRQLDEERLGVGMDMNIDNHTHTYYSVNNGISWSQSSFLGSVMIRPIFSTSLDAFLGVPETISERINVKLYPNPTRGDVNIEVEGGDYQGVEVFNIQGVKVLESLDQKISLLEQPQGVYFFRILGHPETYKIIKQ
ncbi:MAG: T9SS type A sorting domain-containing protein [Crocinitomicaceae bacterium]|nr:T9SS type A sorting domain-containing protein [Crocinitomicaceae bacterium]